MANNYRDYFGSQTDHIHFDSNALLRTNNNNLWAPLNDNGRQTDEFQSHSQSNTNTATSPSSVFIWPKNSKLSATAPEFIPRQSSLNAGAREYIPKSIRDSIDSVKFSQREKLIHDINTGQLECLVCLDKIQPYDAVWSCEICFHILHLNCIMKWAESSETDEGWRCCACQNVSLYFPCEYYCFCGKTEKPQYNEHNQYKTAHSCGNVCARKNGNCPHPCTQPCHPGRCPQCQVLRKCMCGKTMKIYPCHKMTNFLCDQRCDKKLNCEKHKCEKSCHWGSCGVCSHTAVQTCYCKKGNRIVACTKDNKAAIKYSCRQLCEKQLKCGNHKCKRICHAGACGDCDLLPENVKTCPCEKLQIEKGQRTSCTDAIPLCTAKCKKRLTCGEPNNPHMCASKCHLGPCPPCTKRTLVKCDCDWSDIYLVRMDRRQHFHLDKCGEVDNHNF